MKKYMFVAALCLPMVALSNGVDVLIEDIKSDLDNIAQVCATPPELPDAIAHSNVILRNIPAPNGEAIIAYKAIKGKQYRIVIKIKEPYTSETIRVGTPVHAYVKPLRPASKGGQPTEFPIYPGHMGNENDDTTVYLRVYATNNQPFVVQQFRFYPPY